MEVSPKLLKPILVSASKFSISELNLLKVFSILVERLVGNLTSFKLLLKSSTAALIGATLPSKSNYKVNFLSANFLTSKQKISIGPLQANTDSLTFQHLYRHLEKAIP